MVDISTERLIPIREVPSIVPSSRPGKKLNACTLWRWIRSGRLESVKVGGSIYTSVEALTRFATHTGGPPVATPGKVAAQREREIAAAEARLAARGVK